MDKPEQKEGDPKAKADRAKFESVTKVEISPILTKGSRGKRTLVVPDLRSPDEKQAKWHADPEDALAERKAKARAAKRDPKDEA